MTGKDFTATAKKTMNPALSFISKQEPIQETITTPEPASNVPMKKDPRYIETKSKRLQLLMQPSLHTRLKRLADDKGVSLNELIHSALETYAEEEEKRGL